MKNQQVSVDYWAMGKAMLLYGALTAMCWLMLRLFNTVFTLPRRLRAQQSNLQDTLKELQKKFPDLNITEEDLENAEKDLDEFIREEKDKETAEKKEVTDQKEIKENNEEISQTEETKKTL